MTIQSTWECETCGLKLSDVLLPVRHRCKEDRSAPCVHLGEWTGKKIKCDSCRGQVLIKVMTCELLGECTVKKGVGDIAICKFCPHYRKRPD